MHPLINLAGGRLLNLVFDGLLKRRDPFEAREERLTSELATLTELGERLPPTVFSPPVSPQEDETTTTPDVSSTSQVTAEGKGCIPCAADHFSTVAGALTEALRFARTEGMYHQEVLERIALAFDELNIMERIDAAPEKLERLPEEEQSLMRDATVMSRDLRHSLSDLTGVEDLEAVAAMAQKSRTDFRKRLFRLQLGRLQPEDRQRIQERTREMFDEQFVEEQEETDTTREGADSP